MQFQCGQEKSQKDVQEDQRGKRFGAVEVASLIVLRPLVMLFSEVSLAPLELHRTSSTKALIGSEGLRQAFRELLGAGDDSSSGIPQGGAPGTLLMVPREPSEP